MSLDLRSSGDEVVLPGFVNAHSHVFHRALKGLSETRSGDFWSWRELMYSVAERLEPDSLRELSTCVFAEMLLAGYTTVGEFHYLHHNCGGAPYDDPNEMSYAILQGAEAAGIRITLLDTCYLQAGPAGDELTGAQLRFSDRSGACYSERAERGASSGRFDAATRRFGVAAHSVRAVGREEMREVGALAALLHAPFHLHLSEQERENEECLSQTGLTPTGLMYEEGLLGEETTAVHATHLTPSDVELLGESRSGICACPTTERDLGDGIGPFAKLSAGGAVLSIGSDSQTVIDPFEECRSVEWHERLAQEKRGVLSLETLFDAGTKGGARALGWSEDELDDWVTVDLSATPAIAGAGSSSDALAARVLYGASPGAVKDVVVGGSRVVEGGEHVRLGPRRSVSQKLSAVIAALLLEGEAR